MKNVTSVLFGLIIMGVSMTSFGDDCPRGMKSESVTADQDFETRKSTHNFVPGLEIKAGKLHTYIDYSISSESMSVNYIPTNSKENVG